MLSLGFAFDSDNYLLLPALQNDIVIKNRFD